MRPFASRAHAGIRSLALALSAGLISVIASQSSTAAERIDDFGDNPGDLLMYLHRPADAAAGLPLVVALHGCQQSASVFDDETGLVALADEIPFLLLLPEQQEANMFNSCFRWYDTDDNQPGLGESASILSMVDFAIRTEGVDPDEVYVLGLSAGGAMTAVLMANYPDRFAGGAILAGLPYGCNRPVNAFDVGWYWRHTFGLDGIDASYACGIVVSSLTDRDPEDWRRFVLDTLPAEPAQWPPISLWQGTGDETVDPDNLQELTEQWTALHGIDTVADSREEMGGIVREVYSGAAGDPLVETWSLDGFGHAVPVDPDGEPETCGLEGAFILDADICAVRRIAEFWQLR
ncbi:alpha/beta hydrolase family esterase [Aestuariibius sp. 2305UL40-4]|uniref:extracellular catalytic domain type 1 short-chain-length polyhydroxyalkanoate depolymerase n=1 Tax=Aestuariibius violaceus TaxID=3234132 RepID=UPI00345E2FEF